VKLPEPLQMSEALGFELIETHQLADDLRLRLRPRVAPAAEA